MRADEFIFERRSNTAMNVKLPISTQIQQIIQKNGGTIDDYWVSSTTVDRLGFYGGSNRGTNPEVTRPGKAPVVPTKAFQGQRKYRAPEYATYAQPLDTQPKDTKTQYGLWFMPLKSAIKGLTVGRYPYMREYLFLVKLKDDAWLQPVNTLQKLKANLVGIKPPPGKRKVGQYNSSSNIAVLFEPAFNIVGKWTKEELMRDVRRNQIGGIEAQQRVGQERAAEKKRLDIERKKLDDLF